MRRPTSIPTVQQLHGLEEYVDLDNLFESPLLKIRYWKCLHDGRMLREERTHEWDVLSMVDHGAFVHHMEGDDAMIDPTCVVLNEAWRPYRTTHPFGCGDHGFHVMLHRHLLGESPRQRRAGVPVARIVGRSQAALAQRLLVRRLRSGLAVDSLEVEETVLELLSDVLDDLDRGQGTETSLRDDTLRDREQTAEAVRAFLWEHLYDPLRIDDVARAVHVSAFHLCRIFKSSAGETIHQYRHRLRLLEALEPVGELECDLTTLALDSGFSSHSHFTASFRRLFGITPSQFRRLSTARRLQVASSRASGRRSHCRR